MKCLNCLCPKQLCVFFEIIMQCPLRKCFAASIAVRSSTAGTDKLLMDVQSKRFLLLRKTFVLYNSLSDQLYWKLPEILTKLSKKIY